MKIIIILCGIILFSESVHSLDVQSPSDDFKLSAIAEMDEGRYGQAIDLLNKYITANPQNYEGYYLRGLCYEARGQYEYSVYDLRSAIKLNKTDLKVNQALSQVTDVWYTQLYNKIEGHKREIAINSNKPINYLEIGKCYKNLGNWSEAEEWYDKYLLLEDPSPDEVIRYTEILAKNNHIKKGEIILKKFVEKFPDDHRLWSRYGYFTLWLGKNKIAIDAFTEALKFRPFFKEAIDGLYLAKGKGALYTVNDTSYHYNRLTGTFQKQKEREYPIDKYTRLLKRDPLNDSIRIELINELISVNRLEEAKQQLAILKKNKDADLTVLTLEKNIREKLELYTQKKINDLKLTVSLNPTDRKAVMELANHYILKNDIDSAEAVYLSYLNKKPDDDEMRFDLAKKLSWFKQFDKVKVHIDYLLSKNPNEINYQFLRAQIAVWTDSDLELANALLNKVINKGPNNIEALLSLAALNYQSQKFAASENYILQIEKLDPANTDAKELKRNLYIRRKQTEEMALFNLLEDARNYLSQNNCERAIFSYTEYLRSVPDNDRIKLELADAYTCLNDYPNAIKIYTSLIDKNNDYDLIKQRAKWYFWSNDSLNALKEFKSLFSLNKDDVEVKLFLGDSYFKMKDYVNAKKIYNELLSKSPSSLLIKDRMTWFPDDTELDGTFFSFISNLPNYTLLTPEYYYYNDNLSFKYNLFGLHSELGLTNILAIGGTYYRGDVSSDSLKEDFNTLVGTVTLNPTNLITASFSFGQTKYLSNRRQNISELSLKSEIKDKYSVIGKYSIRDAAQTLFSPFIIDTNLNLTEYSIEGQYNTPTQMILSGSYSFNKISDGNKSNQLVLRLGRKFSGDFIAGYEYYNLAYDFETTLYYSPDRFESHSLWADYNIIKDDILEFTIGGKVGLIPNSDLMAKEFNSKLNVKFLESFTLQAQIIFSENARDTVAYKSTSASVMAFWVF